MASVLKAVTLADITRRFWDRVDKSGECWEWTGCLNSHGYGNIWFQGRQEGTHRVAYMLTKGKIPQGKVIRHSCNNRSCVNPKHLSTGTPGDNARDRAEFGNQSRGESSGTNKLSNKQVREIYTMDGDCESIAKKFGVDRTNVGIIRRGKGWTHITEHPTKGRTYTQEREDLVLAVYDHSGTYSEISQIYGVCPSTISHIKNRKSYKDILNANRTK